MNIHLIRTKLEFNNNIKRNIPEDVALDIVLLNESTDLRSRSAIE